MYKKDDNITRSHTAKLTLVKNEISMKRAPTLIMMM
jgi:hypothetical protein